MSQRQVRNLSQKLEIVSNIAESLGLEVGTLLGLEKSPKAALRSLEKAVAGSQRGQEALALRENYVKTMGTKLKIMCTIAMGLKNFEGTIVGI